ncbi:hypothetical protein [Cellulomonas sp. URHB0016]
MTHLTLTLPVTTASTYADDEYTPSAVSFVGMSVAIVGIILLVAVSLGAAALIRRGHRPLRWFGLSAAMLVLGLLVMWLGGAR